MIMKAWVPTGIAIGLISVGGALAQGSERVANHTDWSVFVADSPKECYIVSPPTESAATRGGSSVEVRRGDIRLFVAFRPSENISNEVSFTGGYPFDSGTPVQLEIGSDSFAMTPGSGDAGEWAWTDPADDANAVEAMRGGSTATITAVSTRGTTTTDTFSLMGFTAAVSDAESRCQ